MLANRVALVTGSSRGIGAAIATLFAERGARVAVHGRDAAALASVRAQIERAGGQAISVRADVTRFPEIEAMRLGNIITMSSSAARRPHPRSPIAYAAAKAGIQILTQDVAAQAGPYDVRVNCIAPETILTEGNRRRIPEETRIGLVEGHPLRRLGTPEDVARAALFLASEESSWITGVVLDVTGGAVMVS